MTNRSIGATSLLRHLGAWRGAKHGPAYRQLADALQLLVLDGRLPLGVRLPSERELADALDVSRTMVTAAFAALRASGFLETRRGAGAYTALPGGPGVRPPAFPTGSHAPGVIDLAAASLPADEAVHGAYASALNALPAYLPSHGYDGLGLKALRTQIAERYARRGLPTVPSQIMVTNGALHGFSLLLRLLTGPGDRVVVDQPTYPSGIDAIQRAACRAIPVPLPREGWDVDGLAAAFLQNGARMAYLIPDFHNPTGRCMTPEARGAVAAAAARTRTVLVFDETLRDLGLDAEAPGGNPRAEADVIRLGSMGKSFWGGLRIGWIRAGVDTIDALSLVRPSLDLGTPVLEQLAAATLLRTEAGLGERRALLRHRRDLLLELMERHLPSWRAVTPAGGLSLWAELPEPVSTTLAAGAERYGVRVAAGPRFGVDGALERFVRLPYSQPADALQTGIARLERAYGSVTGSASRATSAAKWMPLV